MTIEDEISGALKHTISTEEAARLLEFKYSSACLWKIGVGEPTSSNPIEWFWVMAPDLPAAHRVVTEWFESTGWLKDTPLDTVVAAELISTFVLASAAVRADAGHSIEWLGTKR